MEDNKEWKFNCPVCKKGNRLVQSVVDDDREKKRLDAMEGAVSIQELPIKDNTKVYKVGDEISTLRMYIDICSECGSTYTFKIVRDIKKMKADVSHLIRPSIIPPKLSRGN